MATRSIGWHVMLRAVCATCAICHIISLEPALSKDLKREFYSNEALGVSFPIPEGLDLYTPEHPGPLASLFSEGQIIYLVNPDFKDENIGASCSSGITESDLKQYKELLDTNPNPPPASLPGYKKISVNFIKIGAKRDKLAVEYIFNMKGNMLGTLRQIIFIHKDKAFTFTCATAKERYEQASADFFNPIFSTMEFQ